MAFDWSDTRLERTAHQGASQFVLCAKCYEEDHTAENKNQRGMYLALEKSEIHSKCWLKKK
jgi:hypothetical protein